MAEQAGIALQQSRCAEYIAVLSCINEMPIEPCRNLPLAETGILRGRTLSFEQEKDLTSALVFLSNIRHDPNYITALCVEERKAELRVLIAVNTTSHIVPKYLRDVDVGFLHLFSILRGAETS